AALGVSVAAIDVGGQTLARIDGDVGQGNSTVRNVTVLAESHGTLQAQSTQAGLSAGLSLTGSLALANFSPLVQSRIGSDADIRASGEINVEANSAASVNADALGISLSYGIGAGASISLANAAPQLSTVVNGRLRSTGGGAVNIKGRADVDAMAESNAASAGLLFGGAGGVAVSRAAADVTAQLGADGTIHGFGAATIQAEALNHSEALARGLAGGLVCVGVSYADARTGGAVAARSDGDVNMGSLSVEGHQVNVADADSYALAGGLIAAGLNIAVVDMGGTVLARLGGASTTRTSGDVTVRAHATNSALARGHGTTVGGLAVGGMKVDTRLGNTGVDEEVTAGLDAGAVIEDARYVIVTALSEDLLHAEAEAAAGGAIVATGAKAANESEQSTLATVGSGALVHAKAVTVQSINAKSMDVQADSLSLGLASGAGAMASNRAVGDARIDVASGADITAVNISFSARNSFAKDTYATSLRSASAALVSDGLMTSDTQVGTNSDRFEASIDVGSGAIIRSVGDNSDPGLLRLETYTNALVQDSVELDSYGGLAFTLGTSKATVDSDSRIRLDGAQLTSKASNVDIATRSSAEVRTDADVTIATLVSGVAGAAAFSDIDARNTVQLVDATIKGQDINLYAGRDASGQVNLIDAYANTDIRAYSLLPNISSPSSTVVIGETNLIDVLGDSKIQALKNAIVRAVEGVGGDDRGTETGQVVSLSLIPYGISVDDSPTVSSSNTVVVAPSASIEAGINNQAVVRVLPRFAGGVEQLAQSRLDTALSAGEKTALGLSAD
ncbi:MAG: hypothetical protein OEW36_11090, partial [Hylemonella sp.]|nr:hypothetical protein [Hylemonella sp.]